MKNRKFMAVLAIILICILSAAGCGKKNVGSPEDNPVQEEDEEEPEEDGQTEGKDIHSASVPSIWKIPILSRWKILSARS